MKLDFFIVGLAVAAGFWHTDLVMAQELVRMNDQRHFSQTVPAGNYSGICHVSGNTYALADDKAENDGFRLVEIDIDSVSGELRNVVDKGFVKGGSNKNRDAEGIVMLHGRNSVMVVGEADNRVVEYSADGTETGRSVLLEPGSGNGGYESLGVDEERGILYTCTENPLAHDVALTKDNEWIYRIQAFDTDSLSFMGSWLYKGDTPEGDKANAGNYAFGVSELLPVGGGKTLVLERECYVPKVKVGAWVNSKVYVAQLDIPSDSVASSHETATFSRSLYGAVSPVEKRLLCQWKTRMTFLNHSFANYEGMCLGPKLEDGSQCVILVADSQNQAYGMLKDWFKTIVIK